jgi:hypothetical protein
LRRAKALVASALALCALASPALADEQRPPLQVAVDPGQELPPPPPLLPPPPPLVVAAPSAPPPSPAPPQRSGDGAGPRLSFGRLLIPGAPPDGFYGRFETEYWSVGGRSLVGITLGAEGWGDVRGGGGGLESTLSVGLRQPFVRGARAPCFVFTLAPGWDWLLVDRLYGHTGVGIFAPLVNANLGVDLRGVRLLFDARAQYRWQWGADDHAHYHLGLTINLNSELWDGPAGNTR